MNTQHPDENQLVAWLSGEISGDNKTYIEGHLETCSLCQDVVSALRVFHHPTGRVPIKSGLRLFSILFLLNRRRNDFVCPKGYVVHDRSTIRK